MSESNDQWWRAYDDGRFDHDFRDFHAALAASSARATCFEVISLYEMVLHNCMIFHSPESGRMPPERKVERQLRSELKRIPHLIRTLMHMRAAGDGSPQS